MLNYLHEVFDYIEKLFSGSSDVSIATVGRDAQVAIATAQAAMGLSENVVQLSASERDRINGILASAQKYAMIVANEPTQANLTTLIKTCTDVVGATPAGGLHDKLAAVMAVVALANAQLQHFVSTSAQVAMPVPVAVATGAK